MASRSVWLRDGDGLVPPKLRAWSKSIRCLSRDLEKAMAKKEDVKRATVGSWMIEYDAQGFPFWVNDVTKEATYNLYIDRGCMTSRAIGNGGMDTVALPPWRYLMPVSVKKEEKKEEKKKEEPKDKGHWREIWLENGSRIYEHTGTKRITCRDMFK